MQLPDPPTFDLESEAWAQAAERYYESDSFVDDAIEWAHQWAHEHPKLIDTICDFYADSATFQMNVEDIMDGERDIS